MLLSQASTSVAPVLTDLTTINTFSTVYYLYYHDNESKKQDQGIYRNKVCKFIDFDGLSTWHGLFIMHKYTLDTLIGGRLRSVMNKDDFSTEWSILHRVYSSMITVKQWLTTVEGKFSFLSSSFQDMAESVAKVNTARISIGLQFSLPSYDNINDQNWLDVKDTLDQALCSRGLNDLFSL